MASNNIFKFVSVRPPNPITKKDKTSFFKIKNANTVFRQALSQIGNNLEKLKEKANEFMNSDLYNPNAKQLRDLISKVVKEETAKAAKKVVLDEIGKPLDDFLSESATSTLEDNLWDSFLTHYILEDHKEINYDNIYEGLRALEYLKILSKTGDNNQPMNLFGFNRLKPMISQDFTFEGKADDTLEKALDEKREQLKVNLRELYNKIRRQDKVKHDLKNTASLFSALSQREASLSNEVINAEQSLKFKPISKQKVQEVSFTKGIKGIPAANNNSGKKTVSTGIIPPTKPWVFTDFGNKKLKSSTKVFLKGNMAKFQEMEDIEIRADISKEMHSEVKMFIQTVPKMFYSDLMAVEEFRWIQKKVPLTFEILPWTPPLPLHKTGYSRGLRPLGIGDLMVVKQELIKYSVGEVAHIENVLQSERKLRTHKRMTESEEILTTETEQIEETERDLQTTERFELQKEAQETIETDMKVQAGFNISASYGVVTASAHGDFAYGESSSESTKNASSFAKEVIEKSVSKLIQKTREERTRRTLERVEETNEHGLDNSSGDGHIRGLYRWVDKYYKARVINYGKRLMFEFILPEPAAFYIHTEADRSEEGVTMKEPNPPKVWGRPLEPTDLDRDNYTDFISKYNVQDAEPYPDEIVRISSALAEGPGAGDKKNVSFGNTSDKLKVPEGYKAVDFSGYWTYGGFGDETDFSVFIGGTDFNNTSVRGVEGIIPISVSGYATDYNVSINVKCELKDDGIERWQLKTFQAIMNAYQNELAAYNEEVVSSQIQAGINIEGRNPEFNRKIEKDELRKGSLRILTNNFKRIGIGSQWFNNEIFNAMRDYGAFGYPYFNIKEAQKEGKIIQFFEQAFEWNNMTYRFYPYFWGRKEDWDETFSKEDTDTNFTDFLRAGSARVVVPVHPSYNEAILFYLKTNRIWLGGQPPTLDDPLFISIIDEIKSDTNSDLGEDLPACNIESGFPCISDEWEVKVPTNLVYLQEDAELPDYS